MRGLPCGNLDGMKAVLWFAVAFTIGIYIVAPVSDPDLWWHIVAGRWILAHGALPHVDYWNMFGHGVSWRAYSWPLEVLFAIIDRVYSVPGLFYLQAIFGVVLALSLFYVLGKISADWFFGGVLGILSTAACHNHFTLRPQSLIWAVFAWQLLVLTRIQAVGLRRGTGAALVAVMALWANLHISTILGIFVTALWLFNAVPFRTLLTAVALSVFATLLTPYLGGEWVSFFSHSTHPFALNAIAEFHAATIMQYSTGFLLIALFLLGAFAFQRPSAVSTGKYIVCGIFSLAALAVVKFLPFAVILISAVCAELWRAGEGARNFGQLGEAVARLRRGFFWIPKEGLSFLLLAYALVLLHGRSTAPLALEVVPSQAFDFLQSRKLPLPMLVPFGVGGYQMYRFSDARGELPSEEYRVSIDGRTNVVPPEVWEKFLKSFRGESGWRDYLTLVNPQTILWKTESPLTAILSYGSEWCLIYQSGTREEGYSIFVKHDFFNQNPDLSADNCSHG